jgi:hypothetical protein
LGKFRKSAPATESEYKFSQAIVETVIQEEYIALQERLGPDICSKKAGKVRNAKTFSFIEQWFTCSSLSLLVAVQFTAA